MTDIWLLIVSFALLLAGAFVFTNAIEWAGVQLNLGHGAVGSVLAAVATALPESLIPIVAILSGSARDDIAIGAIIGAPFMLGTLALALTAGAALLFSSRRGRVELRIHHETISRDFIVFLVAFAFAVALGLTDNRPLKIVGAVLLIVAYGVHAWRIIRASRLSGGEEEPAPLLFDPNNRTPPRTYQVVIQNIAGLAMIIGGAHLFVSSVEHLAERSGANALMLALVLAPLASELPEKLNSILWIRDGKDTLALGNITGAMVFQSMLPVSIGLAFTDWDLRAPALAASVAALLGALVAMVAIRRGARFPMYAFVWAALYVGAAGYVINSS
jgi:cation:H+ antiporter